MSRVVPYVGITGFSWRRQVEAIVDILPEKSDRKLMVGILANYKTLNGELTKWPHRYPDVDRIKYITACNSQVLNLIHYNTGAYDTLCDQLCKFSNIDFNGFQLNMAWPKVDQIRNYLNIYPWTMFVLQIGRRAMEEVGGSPEMLAEKVVSYGKNIHYVLLDASGGQGKAMNVPELLRHIRVLKRELKAADLDVGVGIAGGLSPENLDILLPIIQEFPDISIDAEGRLRDECDNLDLEKAKRYLAKSLWMFSTHNI